MKIIRKYNKTLTVDLHGMKAHELKPRLEMMIESSRIGDCEKLILIHGFNNGTALRDIIRNDLKSSRIKKIQNGSNSGETVILLKPKK